MSERRKSPALGKPPPIILRGERKYLERPRVNYFVVVLGMLACVAGVYLLLPFTQMIAGLGRSSPELMTVSVALPPPPPPPVDLEPPEPPPPEQPPPEMQQQVQQLSLSQMDVALNLGVGDALAGGFSFEGFGVDASETASDLQIFDIKDLDRAPAMVRQGQFIYPAEMRRAGVTGVVTLMIIIDQRGQVTVENVVEARIREFVPNAIRFAETSVFEPPTKGGEAVRARYRFPVRFAL